jgi:hypothetical protein
MISEPMPPEPLLIMKLSRTPWVVWAITGLMSSRNQARKALAAAVSSWKMIVNSR